MNFIEDRLQDAVSRGQKPTDDFSPLTADYESILKLQWHVNSDIIYLFDYMSIIQLFMCVCVCVVSHLMHPAFSNIFRIFYFEVRFPLSMLHVFHSNDQLCCCCCWCWFNLKLINELLRESYCKCECVCVCA